MQKSADAFRTISEVADDLSLPQHVLRFWETRFPQVRPLKRAGGRRYYRPTDVSLLRTIRQLLYDDGYTIKGVQRLLKEQGAKGLGAREPGTRLDDPTDALSDLTSLDDVAADESLSVDPDPEIYAAAAPPAARMTAAYRHLVEEALAAVEDCQRILDALPRGDR